MPAESRQIFGLALDSRISWATATANADGVSGIEFASCDSGSNIVETLTAVLDQLNLKEVNGIGISSVGVVDGGDVRLLHGGRTGWPAIDFKSMFTGRAAPKVVEDHLAAHNDATASALAEYVWAKRRELPQQKHGDRWSRLFYLFVGEGVNAGVILDGGRPPSMIVHPEIGHVLARIHDDDDFNPEIGGCRLHYGCFEGIASASRIRRSWGGENPTPDFNLKDLAEDHPAWSFIAFYVAQLCMVGALTHSPDRFVLGGNVIHPALLPLVRHAFDELNGRYLPQTAVGTSLIKPALFGPESTLLGALELARLAAFEGRKQRLHNLRVAE